MNSLLMHLIVAAPASGGDGAAAAAQQAAEGAGPTVFSVWELALKGGPMMIPIGVASLIGVAIAADRIISTRRRNVAPPSFMEGVRSRLADPAKGVVDARDYCEKSGSAVARVFAAGLGRIGEPVERIERRIEEEGERVARDLRKNLRGLAVIATITPLMGLLGTIFGMISAFQTVSISGEALGKTELLAGGIYEAMITTAAGLLVAIPALIVYHWITARIERLIADIDAMTVELLEGKHAAVALPATHARGAEAAGSTGSHASDNGESLPVATEIGLAEEATP